jgi:Dolichyl-phosphate-mannose-protein mannosyltransferase
MRARARSVRPAAGPRETTVLSRMSETLWTGELLVYAVLILASLPARLSAMRASLWLDEAWVANSILSPSWKEMFYYPRWLQPTPALFLALSRLLTKVLGPSEAALRFLPVLAAVAAIPVLAIALRKLFGPAAALCGTSLVIVNFWAVKYAQQVKQFGSDVFACALLVFLVTRYCLRPDRRNFTLLVGGFVVMFFLSTTAIFMGPTVMAAVALGPLWRVPSDLRAGRLKIAVTALALGGVLNYLVFMRPNRGPSLVAFWTERCLKLSHPFTSGLGLFSSFGELLVPQVFPGALFLGTAIVLPMIAGMVIAVIGAARGSRKAVVILLLGPLPLAVAMGFSLLGVYPLLHSPRMLLWSLPGCAVLLATALDQLFNTLRQRMAWGRQAPILYGTAVMCFFAVLVLNLIAIRYPRPNEQNGEAMRLLHQSMGPADTLFVHRRMVEQYYYYSRLQGWAPARVYIGNTGWPTCCARNLTNYDASTDIQSYVAELHQIGAQLQRPGQVWMLLPWGRSDLVWKMEATPSVMQLQSCQETHREGFDQTLVLAYQCR